MESKEVGAVEDVIKQLARSKSLRPMTGLRQAKDVEAEIRTKLTTDLREEVAKTAREEDDFRQQEKKPAIEYITSQQWGLLHHA